jgi:hypothetical protein
MSAYSSADGLRVLLLILAAIAQIAASAAPRLLGWEHDISSRSQSLPTPIVPQGWAFSIWGLIFLGSLAFAIFAALPGQLASPIYRKVGWLAVALFTLAALWELWVPIKSLDAVSAVMIFAQLGIGVMIVFTIAGVGRLGLWDRVLMQAPLSLFAGWITAAAFVGLGSVLMHHGYSPSLSFYLGMVVAIAAIALWTTWAAGGWFYAAAVLWALGGIIIANMSGGSMLLAGATGVGAVLLILAAIFRS